MPYALHDNDIISLVLIVFGDTLCACFNFFQLNKYLLNTTVSQALTPPRRAGIKKWDTALRYKYVFSICKPSDRLPERALPSKQAAEREVLLG